jgi:DnaK suppressor protein
VRYREASAFLQTEEKGQFYATIAASGSKANIREWRGTGLSGKFARLQPQGRQNSWRRKLPASWIRESERRSSMPIKAKAKVAGSQLIRGFEPYKESKGEEYMSDSMRAHFTGILQKWKQELMEEVDRTVLHMQDEAANFPDPADRASQEEEFSLELRARDRERKLIKKIDETIQLIEDNDYGWCDSCGVEIGIRRLEARPTATLCIDCKTLAEIKEKQIGS